MTEAEQAASRETVLAAYAAREAALADALAEYRRKVAEAEAELVRKLGPQKGG